jgi:NTP pyrophosphatase (non-canonical NTP hydrolase)
VSGLSPKGGTFGDNGNWTALQRQIAAWVETNFPGTPDEVAVLGLAEESGEVCRAVLKRAQGIRGTREEWDREIAKELGDVVIVAFNIAARFGIDLGDAVFGRWVAVGARNWTVDKVGHGIGGES